MDEKVKNDEKKVMLVRQTGEGKDGRLKAVGSIDEDGNIETLDPTAVNTNQPALEAFFTKFMEQSQDPVKTGVSEIFIMAESVLNKLIKIDLDPQLLENYRVDPSQGTHFFQNLTSFGVGYFTINPFKSDGWFDVSSLWIFRKSTRRIWSAWVSVWKTSNPI